MKLHVPWIAVDDALGDRLAAELRTEMAAEHALVGMPVKVVARRTDRDDVLVALPEDRWSIVHLTWRGKTEPDPRYPSAKLFSSTAEISERLELDHVTFTDAD